MNILNKINQKGDTLVEVLICIVLIGTILTGGYEATNQSLKAEGLAQDRSNALQIAESQIEQLRGIVNTGQSLPAGVTFFCIDSSNLKIINLNTSPNDPHCNYSSSGMSDDTSSEPIFTVSITYKVQSSPSAPDPTFTVQVLWNQGSNQTQNVTLYYKLYTS